MIEELLEKLKNAKSKEEARDIVKDSKSVLTDEDLDIVSGGVGRHFSHM